MPDLTRGFHLYFHLILGLSKKSTCLQGRVAEWPSGRVAEINFGRCLPMSTTLAAAAKRGRPP